VAIVASPYAVLPTTGHKEEEEEDRQIDRHRDRQTNSFYRPRYQIKMLRVMIMFTCAVKPPVLLKYTIMFNGNCAADRGTAVLKNGFRHTSVGCHFPFKL